MSCLIEASKMSGASLKSLYYYLMQWVRVHCKSRTELAADEYFHQHNILWSWHKSMIFFITWGNILVMSANGYKILLKMIIEADAGCLVAILHFNALIWIWITFEFYWKCHSVPLGLG